MPSFAVLELFSVGLIAFITIIGCSGRFNIGESSLASSISNCRQFFFENCRGHQARVNGFQTLSVECAVISWPSLVGDSSSAIIRWSSLVGHLFTTGDSTSANPPSLPDSAINGLFSSPSYVRLLTQF